MAFVHRRILTEVPECVRYLEALTSALPCSFMKLVEHAHSLCPEIEAYCNKHPLTLKGRDKGSAGKLAEYYLFGQLPNSSSAADTLAGDIKATHVKQLGPGFNAKERLTLTNVGKTGDYDSLQHILESETLEENRAYSKVSRGIVLVLRYEKGEKYDAIEKTMQKKVEAVFRYDFAELPEEMTAQLKEDWVRIRDCVAARAVSQKGQLALHIHPHGSKGSSTRALGFTNKFLTQLIAHGAGRKLVKKGASTYFV